MASLAKNGAGIKICFCRTTTSKMAREETESEFLAKLNCPFFIRGYNNNRFEVVVVLEFMREKIRKIEFAIAKEMKEKGELERYDLGLRYILDYYDHF